MKNKKKVLEIGKTFESYIQGEITDISFLIKVHEIINKTKVTTEDLKWVRKTIEEIKKGEIK